MIYYPLELNNKEALPTKQQGWRPFFASAPRENDVSASIQTE